MNPVDKIAWEVLNATADDCENLEQIYRQVCYQVLPNSPSTLETDYLYRTVKDAPFLSEIAERIRTLVEQGFLAVVMDEEGRPWQGSNDYSYVWRCWFQMTPEGTTIWKSMEDLVEQE
jgi:hypothetical protein